MRNSYRTMRIGWQTVFTGCLLLAMAAVPVRAQQASASPAVNQQPATEPVPGNELAKEISNPVTSLWQLQLQFNNVRLRPARPR